MSQSSILLLIVLPSCILILYYIKTKNAERIKLIEKGINPDEGLDISTYRKQTTLKNGILFIFLSMGLLTGHYLVKRAITEEPIGYISMLLLFGGFAFIINYLIIRHWPVK